ncbi:Ferritin-like domain-containing protein [Microlunatus sagamiharensis]|uniref:Ferritin-like domain-containing protein n=1 Tax=Microlunatus sagamiharensis TaxID=546874 RepID=A0A1H2N7R0_9ACTN|nr:ferritin-like domain-containing protein [Microlunatus sagamiharensis]SDV01547.1 Ferritin-like domain-containing protein [Microlunatus sagamiharensis]
MFGKKVVADMISRSAENEHDRRSFLRAAGVAGLGTVGAVALAGAGTESASAAPSSDGGPSDSAILNFALNLEYLEAQFYSYAYWGEGLDSTDVTGTGTQGKVTGGKKVHFKSKAIREYAREIAMDERNHVKFLRNALDGQQVSQPAIDLKTSFTAAARAAGLIKSNQTFDPFANENNFLLGAFIFEDVGVTAYKGAAPLITNKTYLEAAAGILAVEAYHAGIVRSALYQKGLFAEVKKISALRDAVDGSSDDDQNLRSSGKHANIVPTDSNSIAFSRTPANVLNIVYLTPSEATKGGFFPAGVNGAVNTSNNNA